MSNIYTKLNAMRKEFHSLPRRKTGLNQHSKFKFFELEDFIPDVMMLLEKHKIYAYVKSVTLEKTVIEAVDCEEPSSLIEIEVLSAMASIPKATDVQNVGGTLGYMRRYAWTTFLEIVENDEVDHAPQISAEERIITQFVERFHAVSSKDASPEEIEELKKSIKAQNKVSHAYLWDQMKSVFKAKGWNVDDKTGEIKRPIIDVTPAVKQADVTGSLMNLSDDPFGRE